MHHRMLLWSGPENLQEIPNLLVLGTAVGGGIEWGGGETTTTTKKLHPVAASHWPGDSGIHWGLMCEVVHCRDYVGVSETSTYEEPVHLSISGSTKTLCIGWEGHLLGGTSPIPLSSEHTE